MTDGGGPEMVSLRELARRVVAAGLAESMSHQRVSQLARTDPEFPAVVTIGRARAVDAAAGLRYFSERTPRQGARTDLQEKKRLAE